VQGDGGEVGAGGYAGRDDGDGLAAGDEVVFVLDGFDEGAVGGRAAVGSRVDAPVSVPGWVGQPGDVPFRDIAEAIGRQLKLPVVSIAAEEAADHFGFLSAFVSLDNPTSSTLTQELLGWKPERPTLIADIEQGHYFKD
jgi:hypothetical protein